MNNPNRAGNTSDGSCRCSFCEVRVLVKVMSSIFFIGGTVVTVYIIQNGYDPLFAVVVLCLVAAILYVMVIASNESHSKETYENIGTLLTLESVMDSSLELEYITKMRNLVELHILDECDLQTMNEGFNHLFMVNTEDFREFYLCMHHAFLCHSEPIVKVPSLEGVPRNIKMLKRGGSETTTNFAHYRVENIYAPSNYSVSVRRSQVKDSPMDGVGDGDENLVSCLPPTWRRIYSSSENLFHCNAESTESFLRVQRQPTPKRENIWKQIANREIQGPLNQRALLERIASPYYYLFPYQDPEEYSELEWRCWNSRSHPRNYEVMSFKTHVFRDGRCGCKS